MSAGLARASATAFAIHIGGAALTYCAQLLVARAIGADGYGQYAYVFAWMTTLAYLAALGFDVGLLRFVSVYRAQSEWGLLRGVIRSAERWVVGVGMAVALACLAFAEAWSQQRSAELTKTFEVGCWLVPILALLWVRSSTVRALGGVLSALGPDRMLRDGVLAAAVGLFAFLLHQAVTPAWVMAATVLGAALGLWLVTAAKRRRMPEAVRAALPRYAGSVWARAALPLLTLSLVEAAMNRIGVVVLGWAGMTRDAGVFNLAANIALLSVLPRTAINALFAPAIAALHARHDTAALQALATKTSVWALAGAAGIALSTGIAAEPVLRWLGPGFAAGLAPLRIMLLAQVLTAAAGSQLSLLTMTGHERSAAIVMVIGAAANLGLSLLLAPGLGLTGVALAASVSLLGWNGAMAALIWRSLHLIPGAVPALLRAPHGHLAGAGTVRGIIGRMLARGRPDSAHGPRREPPARTEAEA